jgi:hypothetical protein
VVGYFIKFLQNFLVNGYARIIRIIAAKQNIDEVLIHLMFSLPDNDPASHRTMLRVPQHDTLFNPFSTSQPSTTPYTTPNPRFRKPFGGSGGCRTF